MSLKTLDFCRITLCYMTAIRVNFQGQGNYRFVTLSQVVDRSAKMGEVIHSPCTVGIFIGQCAFVKEITRPILAKGVKPMSPNSDYAKIITAAHRGSTLAQEALAVIEDVRFMLLHSCDEHHIIPPRELDKTQVSDTLAHGMLERSPWLKGAVDKYANANGTQH